MYARWILIKLNLKQDILVRTIQILSLLRMGLVSAFTFEKSIGNPRMSGNVLIGILLEEKKSIYIERIHEKEHGNR